MSYTVTIAPTSEPVLAANFRDFDLNITDSTKEKGLYFLVTRIRKWIELKFDRAIITQTILEKYDYFGYRDCLELTVNPVASITSVKYYDEDDALQTFASSNYVLQKGRLSAKIVLLEDKSWPDIKNKPDAVEVTYVAGDDIAPENVQHFIVQAVGRLYYDKEAFTEVMSNIEMLFPETKIRV